MDFRLSGTEERWRQEVRDFLTAELPSGWTEPQETGTRATDDYELGEVSRRFVRRLGERGWLTLAWPKEYRGQARPLIEQTIFNEELGYHRAPTGATFLAINNVGPTLILYGSDAQKQEHLPKIARAEEVWCQGMSEPNAGSDLGSLQTAAVADGDDYVINGTKVWTSVAHRADWCYLMARTDPAAPKHRGISVFLVPMRRPGITVLPLVNMADGHEFNQVLFDNVRVPKENMVGELNRGWYLSTTLLDFERSNIGRTAGARRVFDELVALVREQNGRGGTARAALRQQLAERQIELEVLTLLSYRVVSMQSRGMPPNYETSICRILQGESTQRLGGTGINALALYGQLRPGSRWAPLRGRLERFYLTTLGNTIGGGTVEIQRNIVAQRGLGLPRA
jgi:3-oxocholest-4-en-26-oyl-CoA dehydrogenase alpha subunit